MTIEDYNAATDIITKLEKLDDSICDINHIIQTSDVTKWNMAIRPTSSHPYMVIDHRGRLLEFLNMVLFNLGEERAELIEKLEKL